MDYRDGDSPSLGVKHDRPGTDSCLDAPQGEHTGLGLAFTHAPNDLEQVGLIDAAGAPALDDDEVLAFGLACDPSIIHLTVVASLDCSEGVYDVVEDLGCVLHHT